MAGMKPKQTNYLQAIAGMRLGTLFTVLRRNGFQINRRYLPRLGTLLLLGVVNSALAPCERIQYGRRIRATKIEKPPLFIIGHFRSGTTYLHDLISLDDNFDCPTVYQAMFPHHFCFSQKRGYYIFDRFAPEKRPMDNMALRAAAPHEDEFALAGLCAVSPYLRFLFPVTGDDGYSSLDPRNLPSGALEEWKNAMVHYMKKLTYWKHNKRIVLKSPPHLSRTATLTELFPGAQFIHIVRNPYEVYLSTRHLWKSALTYVHLQEPDPELIDETILSWYSEFFAVFERDRPLIPTNCLCEIKYEDLEKRPLEILEQVYEELGLPNFDQFRERVVPYLQSLKDYKKNVFQLDDAVRQKVSSRWQGTFERYDYPV